MISVDESGKAGIPPTTCARMGSWSGHCAWSCCWEGMGHGGVLFYVHEGNAVWPRWDCHVRLHDNHRIIWVQAHMPCTFSFLAVFLFGCGNFFIHISFEMGGTSKIIAMNSWAFVHQPNASFFFFLALVACNLPLDSLLFFKSYFEQVHRNLGSRILAALCTSLPWSCAVKLCRDLVH